jgi:hypothetical protein
MITAYRQCDTRYAFLWASDRQPEGRWHAVGEGPVQYLADTPDGAWAEFLRDEEIRDVDDLDGISRALWAVELAEIPDARPDLEDAALQGDEDSYPVCQEEAARLRGLGHEGLLAPSAALHDATATPWRPVGEANVPGAARTAQVVALFGARPELEGWLMVDRGGPPSHVLDRVRHFGN